MGRGGRLRKGTVGRRGGEPSWGREAEEREGEGGEPGRGECGWGEVNVRGLRGGRRRRDRSYMCKPVEWEGERVGGKLGKWGGKRDRFMRLVTLSIYLVVMVM